MRPPGPVAANVSAEPRRAQGACRADGSSALGRCRVFHGVVQRFWGDVRTIRPRDRSAIDEELLEICLVFQRFENRALQPGSEVNRSFQVVVERHANSEVARIRRTNDRREHVHVPTSLKGRDATERLARFHPLPIGV